MGGRAGAKPRARPHHPPIPLLIAISLSVSQLPATATVTDHRPGLFLGHNVPQAVEVTPGTLPSSIPNWPELVGEVVGFRPVEAVRLAAAWFPDSDGLAEVEAPTDRSQYVPLTDGRAVDVTSGELVRMLPMVETHPLRAIHERKIRRRLVIAGGKVAVECDHLDRRREAPGGDRGRNGARRHARRA